MTTRYWRRTIRYWSKWTQSLISDLVSNVEFMPEGLRYFARLADIDPSMKEAFVIPLTLKSFARLVYGRLEIGLEMKSQILEIESCIAEINQMMKSLTNSSSTEKSLNKPQMKLCAKQRIIQEQGLVLQKIMRFFRLPEHQRAELIMLRQQVTQSDNGQLRANCNFAKEVTMVIVGNVRIFFQDLLSPTNQNTKKVDD